MSIFGLLDPFVQSDLWQAIFRQLVVPQIQQTSCHPKVMGRGEYIYWIPLDRWIMINDRWMHSKCHFYNQKYNFLAHEHPYVRITSSIHF